MNELQHVGAFVVQFRVGSDFNTGRISGRIEHIASGRAGQFDSVQALIARIRVTVHHPIVVDWNNFEEAGRRIVEALGGSATAEAA
jgi:hypothetical protein